MPGGLQRLLRQAQEQITASYQAFLATEPGLDAKTFKDYHAAGRACLAHLDLALRLGHHRATDPPGAGEEDENVDQLVGQARLALSELRAPHPDEEDDDLS